MQKIIKIIKNIRKYENKFRFFSIENVFKPKHILTNIGIRKFSKGA